MDAVLLPRANNTSQTKLLSMLNDLFVDTLHKRERFVDATVIEENTSLSTDGNNNNNIIIVVWKNLR